MIYLFFPETAGRTLEELSFCKTSPEFFFFFFFFFHILIPNTVFEGEEINAEVAAKVVKQVEHEHHETVQKV